MKISLFNERITILQSETKTDKIGNHLNEWTEFYSCFATISNENPQEVTEHGVRYDNSKLDFTIRYSSEVANISSIGYQIQFKEELYDILGIDHLNYKKKALKLHCQRVER
ncbi:phage head closure protein [Streptococcus ictaluri]|uniref:Phage head-tail adaptor n=1 Tax=Streptococcus ictaluri 707-05 TaxID=764299 RepID=G5K217_9STRE|nr:phage head closure protein [Streptococcus ictaluri]EHI70059.1 putative phage head-tail adaptor [Streptococcus ictaluri 707-05]QBX16574.1 putative head-tail adaptor [Streptococcus phage Javan261]